MKEPNFEREHVVVFGVNHGQRLLLHELEEEAREP
jgi:hypothetical protein